MKSTCIFLVFLCITSFAFAIEENNFKADLESFISLSSQANDAIDTVLTLLNDLKNANVKEQQAADALNKTHEAEGRKQIEELTRLRDSNRKILDNAIAHTKFINDEIKDTQGLLAWITARIAQIELKKKQLADQRCYQSQMFVKNLKEHKDALAVIELLKKDLAPYSNQALKLSQIEDISDKLKMYSHLFNEAAMNEFLQLDKQAWEDNQRAALKIADFKSGTADRKLNETLGNNIIDMLNRLAEHFKQSMHNLEVNEITSAYDFAEWLVKSEKEIAQLKEDHARKTKYLAKLQIDLQIAVTFQKKAQKEWEDSVKALQAAIDDLNAKRLRYAKETARRNAENQVLDEVIKVFKDKVSSVAQYLRSRVEDYQPDQKFDKTDLKSRKIDQQIQADKAQLAKNLAAESTKKF